MYIDQRKFHNLQILDRFDTDNVYGFPCLYPQCFSTSDIDNTYNFIGFNQIKRDIPDHSILHFYLDDYQFERFWNYPSKYLNYFSKFDFVISPDFSMYINMPRSISIYNKYRNNLLSVFMQQHGINLIPCVQWADFRSYDYSFIGIPKYSCISISSQGWLKNDFSKTLFLNGFAECISRLRPVKIVYYGKFLPELYDLCHCDFVFFKPFIRSRFQ